LENSNIVVDVIAKLRDPNKNVRGLTIVKKIGQIVTGYVRADSIERVRRSRNVISLKAARRLYRTLAHSVPEIDASPQQIAEALPDGFGPVNGSGVIVGIVDGGCDFAHRNVRKPDGKTRILYLWDQRGGTTDRSPEDYRYGREFDSDAIDDALLKAPPTALNPKRPHEFLNYELDHSHGTSVMDIAAGSGSISQSLPGGINPPGVAPGADIIFVEASLGDEFETEGSFGNSRHLLEAVIYIFEKAAMLGKPAVVNISLNFDAGPHDGSTPVEEGFDLLLETPGRAIVIAAGNSRARRTHVRRMIHPGRTRMLRWEILSEDNSSNKLDIWYGGQHSLGLWLVSPQGEVLGPFLLNSTFTIFRKGAEAGRVFHRGHDSTNGDNHIVLFFRSLMESGIWKIVLRSLDGPDSPPFEIQAWIELDEHIRSTFQDVELMDSAYTVGTIACGHSTIVVGAYDPSADPQGNKLRLLLGDSAEGPTRDGKQKPEVSAPGSHVRAAIPLTDFSANIGEGTSIAAPHVTGLIALLMQVSKSLLPIERIRELVINATLNDPPPESAAWDTRYGAGRISAASSLRELLQTETFLFSLLARHEAIISETGSVFPSDGNPIASTDMHGDETASVMLESETISIIAASHMFAAPVEPVPEISAGAGASVIESAATVSSAASLPDTRGH